jgi:hypothetical protein
MSTFIWDYVTEVIMKEIVVWIYEQFNKPVCERPHKLLCFDGHEETAIKSRRIVTEQNSYRVLKAMIEDKDEVSKSKSIETTRTDGA